MNTNEQGLQGSAFGVGCDFGWAALNAIADAVVATDVSGRIRYLNPAAQRLVGATLESSLGRALSEFVTVLDASTGSHVQDPISRYLCRGDDDRLGNYDVVVRRDGTRVPVEDSTALMRDPTGEIVGAVLVLRDVTGVRRYVRNISVQSTHDALTRLVNRREFERRLRRVLSGMTGQGEHALVFFDLDRFKPVREMWGQLASGALLRQVAELLRERVRERDTLARVGDDQFALLLEHCPEVEAYRMAQHLVDAVSEHGFHWDEREFRLDISAGLVPVTGRRRGFEEIVNAADCACAAAKNAGGGRVHIYEPRDARVARRGLGMAAVPQVWHAAS